MKAAIKFPIVVGEDAQTALTKYLEGREKANVLTTGIRYGKTEEGYKWWEEMRSTAVEFLHALMRDNPSLRTNEQFQQTLKTAERLEGWQADG